jgi:histidinol-phosphate aminotransferase
MFDIENIIRKNIKELAPYTTARHEFVGEAEVYLDANENAFGSPTPLSNNNLTNSLLQLDKLPEGLMRLEKMGLNRYPDPLQQKVKEKLSAIKGVPTQNIFLGNGSDEAIDVLLRIFCEPRLDNIIICPPTYGMYKVCANINDIQIREVPLTKNFQLDVEGIAMATDVNTKMIFICSPNNPTGNSMARADVESILKTFTGIVVIDEAYINYSTQKTFVTALTEYANLVIMQTLSKAWGLAGLRVGMAFASETLINYMNNVKYPYNINEAAQQITLQALENINQINTWTINTIKERDNLAKKLLQNNLCENINNSDANFILVKFNNANALYQYLCSKGIIVRDRSNVKLIENCLRITIGTSAENEILFNQIQQFYTK